MDHCTSNGNDECVDEFYEIQIPVPWGIIAGKWWGNREQQPVIAIHGWQDNAGTFDTLAPLLLKENVSLLCIDLPGHGLSSFYPEGLYYYIFWDGLHILRRIVKHFKWQKIKLIGHSLGGCIAFLYACSYPDEIDRYVSLDIASPAVRDVTKTYNSMGELVDKFLNYETLTQDQLPRYGYEEMIDIVVAAYGGSCTRDSCKIMMRRGMKQQQSYVDVYHFSRDPRLKTIGLGLIGIEQALEMAKQIRCRVMNIRCNPGMPQNHPEYYSRALQQIEKNAQCLEVHELEGTHHLHLNNPESIYKIVAEFLNRD